MNKMTDTQERLLVCECSSHEHIAIATWFPDDKDKAIYLSIHLKHESFLKRLIQGIKYIFGYKCKYGNFDEIILGEKHLSDLKDMVSYLEKNN